MLKYILKLNRVLFMAIQPSFLQSTTHNNGLAAEPTIIDSELPSPFFPVSTQTDMKAHIFRWLPIGYLPRTMRVCTEWRDIVIQVPDVRKRWLIAKTLQAAHSTLKNKSPQMRDIFLFPLLAIEVRYDPDSAKKRRTNNENSDFSALTLLTADSSETEWLIEKEKSRVMSLISPSARARECLDFLDVVKGKLSPELRRSVLAEIEVAITGMGGSPQDFCRYLFVKQAAELTILDNNEVLLDTLFPSIIDLSNRFKALLDIAKMISVTHPERAKKLLKQAEELIPKLDWDPFKLDFVKIAGKLDFNKAKMREFHVPYIRAQALELLFRNDPTFDLSLQKENALKSEDFIFRFVALVEVARREDLPEATATLSLAEAMIVHAPNEESRYIMYKQFIKVEAFINPEKALARISQHSDFELKITSFIELLHALEEQVERAK